MQLSEIGYTRNLSRNYEEKNRQKFKKKLKFILSRARKRADLRQRLVSVTAKHTKSIDFNTNIL